ncbi:MAG TPA: cytochrome P450 [Ktedonobacterales bacterium]|nr:cytochrome P450 [Ktedonobacterales bacterium]
MKWAPLLPREARHEARLILAANPALFGLLTLGRVTGRVWKAPRIGWIITDPTVARQLLTDSRHTSLLGEGGVGHLWAQLLGDWVNQAFDGPGHDELRLKARDLFTDASSKRHVARVFAEPAARLADALRRNETVDIAETARVWVGRMVADLLGLPLAHDADDASFRTIFAHGERLAALARTTISSTIIPPAVLAEAREILEHLTASVPEAYETADKNALLGRCREAGIPLREARGLASLLLVAGTETAASAMARGVALLYDTGQQHDLRAEPTLLPGAVWEILRVTTPAAVIGRHITADVEASGKMLRSGDRVLILTYTTNNAVGRFDIRRSPDRKIRQLWFGAGAHVCLGAPLARAEITYLLQTLLAQERPWRVIRRHASRNVIIPTYAQLAITCAPKGS